LSAAIGQDRWQATQPRAWADEQRRFFQSLQTLDAFLASDAPLHATAEQLFQGPVADALIHVANWPCCAVSPAALPAARIFS